MLLKNAVKYKYKAPDHCLLELVRRTILFSSSNRTTNFILAAHLTLKWPHWFKPWMCLQFRARVCEFVCVCVPVQMLEQSIQGRPVCLWQTLYESGIFLHSLPLILLIYEDNTDENCCKNAQNNNNKQRKDRGTQKKWWTYFLCVAELRAF